MLLVFSYEHSKPKAFAPLAFLAAIGVGMAAESLITMGVKAGSKAILKKQAYNYSDDIQRSGQFDWAGLNPYRNKDGSITLSPSANDRAKMAGLVGGSMAGMYAESLMNPDGSDSLCLPPIPTSGIVLPIIPLPGLEDKAAYYDKYISFYYLNGDDGIYTAYAKSKVTGKVIAEHKPNTDIYSAEYIEVDRYESIHLSVKEKTTGVEYNSWSIKITPEQIGGNYFVSDKNAESIAADIAMCNELLIPSTVENIYPAPMNMSNTYIMPNNSKLTDIDFTINNVYPPSDTEGYVTWDELEKYYADNNLSFDDVMDKNIDTYLEKGDINYYPITIEEFNNIYTDVDQDEKVEGFDPPLQEVVPVDPDDNLPVPVEPIDKSLLMIAKESYQYLADTVKTSIDGLTAVTAGAAGIITFLGTTMGWLPDEWIVMFSAAFGLGLFAFFFRR